MLLAYVPASAIDPSGISPGILCECLDPIFQTAHYIEVLSLIFTLQNSVCQPQFTSFNFVLSIKLIKS